MTTFSDNLAEYREQAHISRKELAKLLGVSVASIGFYETGRNEPDLQKLVTIAAALHVSVDDLLGHHNDSFDKAAAIFKRTTGLDVHELKNGKIALIEPHHPQDGKKQQEENVMSLTKEQFTNAIMRAESEFKLEIRPRVLPAFLLKELLYESCSKNESEQKCILERMNNFPKNQKEYMRDLQKYIKEKEQFDILSHICLISRATEKGPHPKE